MVHLDGGDTLTGTGHLEVHLAVEVLHALDVDEGVPLVPVGDEAAGDAGHGGLDGHARVHEGQGGAADGALGGGAVGGEDLAHHADGVGELLHGRDGSGPIRGATGSTYVPTALGDYYCEITDAEGTKLTSDSISIIYEEFKVTKQPVGGEMGVVLSVAASGGKAPYSYDWYVGEYSVSEYSDTLQTNDHKISGGFYCKVRDANHLVIESDVARVYFPLKIWKQPVDRYVKVTGYTTLDIRTSGGLSPVTCQWQKWAGGVWRNFNIGESVRVEGTQLGTYRCVVTDQSGAELISNTVTVAEDVLRIEKFELSSVSSINPQYIDFYVTGGSYQNSAVKVWLRNKSGKWSELTDLRKEEKTDSIYYTYKITDNDDKWIGNWVVILAKDQDGGFARYFYNCVESDVPDKYKTW